MTRLITSVGFIYDNMPFGMTWQKPVLTTEDAWDVAALVESQPRPHMEGLERDYPNRLQKPIDAPFGPWPGQFGPEQHRFGPFAPIRDMVRRLRSAAGGRANGLTKPAEPGQTMNRRTP